MSTRFRKPLHCKHSRQQLFRWLFYVSSSWQLRALSCLAVTIDLQKIQAFSVMAQGQVNKRLFCPSQNTGLCNTVLRKADIWKLETSNAWLVVCSSDNASMVLLGGELRLLWTVLNTSLKVEKIWMILPPDSITENIKNSKGCCSVFIYRLNANC